MENSERVARQKAALALLEGKNRISKSFGSAFALDRAKLSRIITIAEGRFTSANLPFEPEYEVVLANGKTINLTQHEDLIALDNTVNNPIKLLEMRASATSDTEELVVNTAFEDNRIKDSVRLRVMSTSSKIADQTFAELEEQVERTLLNGFVYRYLKNTSNFVALLLVLCLCSIVVAVLLKPEILEGPASMTLKEQEKLVDKAAQATTLEQKVDFIFQMEKASLKKPVSYGGFTVNVMSVRFLVIAVPLLLVVGCIFYLIIACYPTAVFIWGDYEEHYAQLVARRKTLWNLVVGALLVGAMASLLASGLAGALGLK